MAERWVAFTTPGKKAQSRTVRSLAPFNRLDHIKGATVRVKINPMKSGNGWKTKTRPQKCAAAGSALNSLNVADGKEGEIQRTNKRHMRAKRHCQ